MNKESQEILKEVIGKIISSIKYNDDADSLHIGFDDGDEIIIEDNLYLCCESRYMTIDDDLNYYIGSKLLGIEIKDGPETEDKDYYVHEIQFLIINTSKGELNISNHNEHNGYYSGFDIRIERRI